jgi:hypothetical protein
VIPLVAVQEKHFLLISHLCQVGKFPSASLYQIEMPTLQSTPNKKAMGTWLRLNRLTAREAAKGKEERDEVTD